MKPGMALLIALLANSTGATPSIAEDEIPHYDPDAYCEEFANSGGDHSEEAKKSCVEIEQSAYDELKETWANIPETMRTYCDRFARSGEKGSYSALKSCVEIEQDAAKENQTKKFKY